MGVPSGIVRSAEEEWDWMRYELKNPPEFYIGFTKRARRERRDD